MRVNLSYSIDIEDVPNKILEFLDEVETQRQELKEISESVSGAIKERNYIVATEQAGAMCDVLASIDMRLDDCMSILGGYSKTLTDIARKETKTEYPPEVVQALSSELAKIQEKRDDLMSKSHEGG